MVEQKGFEPLGPYFAFSSKNCPRIWRRICLKIKASLLQRASSPGIRPEWFSLILAIGSEERFEIAFSPIPFVCRDWIPKRTAGENRQLCEC